MLLEQIDSPKDLKQLSIAQLPQLAQEIRHALLTKVSQTGGHVGPNLGDVELTIAFHYVFDSPTDKVVWDVSHQSYTHKILTGRKQAWLDPAHYDDVSGFTAPEESPHDFFTIGHTSTSVGLATGMAIARDHKHEPGNIVAVIGDGSLSGGLAYEALNNAAVLAGQLLIVVNDNEMSIAENHGGIYENLKLLRDTEGKAERNLFKAIGLDYRYEAHGNDVAAMIAAFRAVRDLDHPLVLHVHTDKGLGYAPAEIDKEHWHWHVPFDLTTAEPLHPSTGVSYNSLILDRLEKHIADDDAPIYALNAAIPGSFGLKRFAADYPKRYIDVGIAEQVSITLAAGMAQQDMRPVVFHSGTFLQRAYDQLSHDLGINKLPAVLILNGGSVSGGDPTHQGTFDIAMLANIPNLTYLAPTTKEELLAQLDWALTQTAGPVAIRVPAHGVQSAPLDPAFAPTALHVLHRGSKVALLGLGSMLATATAVAKQLAEHDIDATVVDPRSTNAWAAEDLDQLADHALVVTLEEGSLDGGFGQKVAAHFGPTATRVLTVGAKRQFNDRESTAELMARDHLTPELITADILKALAD
ncbi:1-deoxy-D-xylulose-5-phosphate synthase [Lacticaseibacillus kribbianus]|uniref:1-deoxy-D-xylulose-5-phosphate synthase n=1 Tax=Lacticaseibacillus kribbianus TaxID=2926292 RepID=UPI001CD3ABC1|nr:1-deoxy-D-xylulose-5-phosphate synthase [Lacticaseibacillus kribbianus]